MTEITARLSTALADRYRIERHLGEGGMATVYLAEDLKHKRKVAVKVLRPELAAVLGAERFVQEIKTTANLQHPHILPLHDSGDADGFLYYVMPYIEGETLRDKLNRETQLGIDEAVKIATEVADALDYAHRNNVIHRDIKPENILLHDGRPMVADFGIALALSAAAGGRMTETGMSLGTPHYMSPEQATAERDITNRSDIYSLGCVLYEMLTGDPPHTGSSAQAILMKIVTEDVQPVTELRKSVPPHVAAATGKALEKLPADRFATAKEFAEALTNPSAVVLSPVAAAAPPGATALVRVAVRHRWLGSAIPLGLALLAGAAIWGWLRSAPSEPQSLTRFVINLPPNQHLPEGASLPLALSPDGNQIVFTGQNGGRAQLYLRALNDFDATPIPGTEGASQPFFSPDGQWVGFWAGGTLQKVAVRGGAPSKIGDLPTGFRGASWGPNDTIILGGVNTGLSFVSAGGGEPVAITSTDMERSEDYHAWPEVLPGGKGVLFTIHTTGAGENSDIGVLSLETGEWRILAETGGAVQPRYLDSDHLVYARGGGLFAVQFDARELRPVSSPTPVLSNVHTRFNAGLDVANFAVSRTGSLVYVPAGVAENDKQIVFVDREGGQEPLAMEEGNYRYRPRLSADGERLAVSYNPGPGPSDIWIQELGLGTRTRLTTDGSNIHPVWTPDGSRVTFASFKSGSFNLYWKLADGSSEAEPLLIREHGQFPLSWSPDGGFLAFVETNPDSGADIWILHRDGDPVSEPFLTTAFNEDSPAFSPDGRWLAYESDETGRYEVYVQPYPPGRRWAISTNGGREPVWSPNRNELFYRDGDSMMVVAIETDPVFTSGVPRFLFQWRFQAGLPYHYDVTPDGKQFVMITGDQEPLVELNVVLNWFEELKAKVGN